MPFKLIFHVYFCARQKKSLISVSGTHRQVSYYMFMFLCIGPFEVPFKVIESSLSTERADGTQPGGVDERCPPAPLCLQRHNPAQLQKTLSPSRQQPPRLITVKHQRRCT